MDRDDVTSAGLTAIGIVAGTVARAVALGGRLVAAGLETLETVLHAGEDDSSARSESRPSSSRQRRESDGPDEDAGSSFAPSSEPAFEPADGITAPARPARSAIRRSSAGAAARTGPGPRPRPAKRATAKSLPPNLRPLGSRERSSEPGPVKGAAGAADVDSVGAAGTAKAAAEKSTAKKTTAKKTTAKKTTATATGTEPPAPAAAEVSPPTGTSAATTSPARKNAARKAPPARTGTKKAAPAQSTESPAPAQSTESPAPAQSTETPAPAQQQAPPADSPESAHTRPEGTPEA